MANKDAQGKISASGAPSSIGNQFYAATYDFSQDGGASADTYNLLSFADKVAVRLVAVRVETAFTSGGAATLSLGVGVSGSELLSASAIAGFTAGAVVNAATPAGFYAVPADGAIVLQVGTADLTAGKAEFLFEVIAA